MSSADDRASPYVLAPYGGDHPPAPTWFDEAVAAPFETTPLGFKGVQLELLCWGKADRPGLLLLHGNNAHARWWSPIAALLADEFRVAALSWSGMGGSDWRSDYSVAEYAEQAMAAVEAAGLFAAAPPVLAGHSFGGSGAIEAAMQHGDRLAGVILLDSLLGPQAGKPMLPPRTSHRVYPTLADALARFRLAPAQPCANHYYVDYIARHGLKPAAIDGSDEPGWTWRIDPTLWEKIVWHDKWRAFQQAKCPLALVMGSQSIIVPQSQLPMLQAEAPAGTSIETIADAGHHVLLDQPLQVVDAIRRYARAMIAARR